MYFASQNFLGGLVDRYDTLMKAFEYPKVELGGNSNIYKR
jgi:hypothetical protein